MQVSSTKLRENIYRLLDQVLETGQAGQAPEVRRKGRKLVISAQPMGEKLSRLRKRPTLAVDPEEIVHIDWSPMMS